LNVTGALRGLNAGFTQVAHCAWQEAGGGLGQDLGLAGRHRPQASLRPVKITREHHDALIAHAREEAPNECCGYVRGRDGRIEEVVRSENLRASPYGYELDSRSLLKVNELDDEGHEVGIYHSHPKSTAEPSQTDINLAHYPHWTYLIVSLAGEPEVRAWRIADGRVEEEPVEVA
jgi:proteasome lid subunit RPN8/RPN11